MLSPRRSLGRGQPLSRASSAGLGPRTRSPPELGRARPRSTLNMNTASRVPHVALQQNCGFLIMNTRSLQLVTYVAGSPRSPLRILRSLEAYLYWSPHKQGLNSSPAKKFPQIVSVWTSTPVLRVVLCEVDAHQVRTDRQGEMIDQLIHMFG